MTRILSFTASASLTPDSVVDSIAVTPTSATIPPSGNRTFTAALSTSGGRPLSTLPTSWTIGDAVNFTLVDNGDGTATVAAGAGSDTLSTTIAAHYSAVDSNSVPVACSAVAPGPNEPDGQTMLVTHDGTAVQPNASWDLAFALAERGSLTTIIDPDHGSAVQLEMTPQTWPGEGSGTLDAGASTRCLAAFAPTRVYLSWWGKLGAGWVGNNGAGGTKYMWLMTQSQYTTYGTYFGLFNQTTGPTTEWPTANVKMCFVSEGLAIDKVNGVSISPPGALFLGLPNQGAADDPGDVMPRDTWHFFEAQVDYNKAGAADGSFILRIDGVEYPNTAQTLGQITGLTGDAIQWTFPYTQRLTTLVFQNTWGGGGTVLSCDNKMIMTQMYVSGGYVRSTDEPNDWLITAVTGETTTPSAGGKVYLVGQLRDQLGDPVAIFGQLLSPTLTPTGPATLTNYLNNPNWGILSNFDVQNASDLIYDNGGVKKLAAGSLFDTGTTATIAAGKWNAANLTIDASGVKALTWADAGGGASYADEGTAIAALPSPGAGELLLMQLTVQADASLWTPGTDALAGGTGGTPAAVTNYYQSFEARNINALGKLIIEVDVSGGAISGDPITVAMDDYARTTNNTANGTHRTSNTYSLTVA